MSTTTIGAIILRDAWTCAYCDKDLEVVGAFHQERSALLVLDHVIARTRGGSSRHWNVTVACHGCNMLKGEDLLAEVFPERIEIVEARLALPLDRDAGRLLGDDLYHPWAEARRADWRRRSKLVTEGRRAARAQGLGGSSFPFGNNLEA